MFFDRQKSHADRILAWSRQAETQRLALARKKLVRNLNQHTGAIAGFRIATAGATVSQIDEDLNTLVNNLVGLVAANAGYEADSASIVLVCGVIKTLRR